jgi:hypothetical protein
MKTHNLKAFKSVEYFYQINQLNEEQLSGEKLSTHLTNITMAFWYDLTAPIAANPDSYDIHSHGVDGPYRCLKMTPGADVIDGLYDRIQDKAVDLEKALNKAFNTKAFDLKVRREGGELDLLVSFVSADGGIFQCNSQVNGGSFGVALRIPNDEEMKVTFDSMAQVPAPTNVEDDDMDVESSLDLEDIPETDPEMEPEMEEEIDLLEPKKKFSSEYDNYADAEQPPFDPVDDDKVEGEDLEDSPGTYIALAEEDNATKLGKIEGILKALIPQIDDEKHKEALQAIVDDIENKEPLNFDDLLPLLKNAMDEMKGDTVEGKYQLINKKSGEVLCTGTMKDCNKKRGELRAKLGDKAPLTFMKAVKEDLEQEMTAVGTMGGTGGEAPGAGDAMGPCGCCGQSPCRCGPNCQGCKKEQVEITEYRYVSLQKLNPFQR